MSGRFSKSEIDRLGDRIRAADRLAVDDLRALQALRDERETALLAVKEALHELGFRATARLKTHNTIIEKLRRQQELRLSRVQDIAGCRIVVRGGRAEQDRAVAQLLSRYPGSRVVDRRIQPSQGYRAVPVVAPSMGGPWRFRCGRRCRMRGHKPSSSSRTCTVARFATEGRRRSTPVMGRGRCDDCSRRWCGGAYGGGKDSFIV